MSRDVYTAATAPAMPGKPLVFAFHGTGGDETQFFGLARQLVPGTGVVAPRGDVLEGTAARFFRRTGEGVYDMADLEKRTATMADYVRSWKSDAPERRIWGFGYSNGANILASVMMAAPDLFDRVALLHPLIPWAPDPVPGLAGKPVLVTAGRRDPITPLPETERLLTWLSGQGADVTTAIHDGGHELRQTEIAALAAFFDQAEE